MRLHLIFRRLSRVLACSCLFASVILSFSQAHQAPQKSADKKPEKPALPEKAENPAQIELLETRYRFEANGDSRKEVHTRVHISTELGVRQFARLNFDYNRAFQSIEIPLVHITHPSGGTADILPSAITDQPNPLSSTPPPTKTFASNPSASSASLPATTSNTASSPPPPTTLSPPTSGSTIPSTAPASSPKKSSNSTSPPPAQSKCASIQQH